MKEVEEEVVIVVARAVVVLKSSPPPCRRASLCSLLDVTYLLVLSSLVGSELLSLRW